MSSPPRENKSTSSILTTHTHTDRRVHLSKQNTLWVCIECQSELIIAVCPEHCTLGKKGPLAHRAVNSGISEMWRAKRMSWEPLSTADLHIHCEHHVGLAWPYFHKKSEYKNPDNASLSMSRTPSDPVHSEWEGLRLSLTCQSHWKHWAKVWDHVCGRRQSAFFCVTQQFTLCVPLKARSCGVMVLANWPQWNKAIEQTHNTTTPNT